MPLEHPLPFPFILFAEASDENIGAGIDRVKMAKAKAATVGKSHFINVSSIHVLSVSLCFLGEDLYRIPGYASTKKRSALCFER